MVGSFPEERSKLEKHRREALVRDIREELDTEISVDEYIDTIEYDYPSFHLSMDCFWCSIRFYTDRHLTFRFYRQIYRKNVYVDLDGKQLIFPYPEAFDKEYLTNK